MTKLQRSNELLLRRTKDRLCAEERKKAAEKVCPVMFISDRGHGIRSRIKGHVKYGGTWKEKIHSRYTSVFVTNEHNSSQTCVFCFKKLTHSIKIVEKNNEAIINDVKGTFRCLNKHCILSVFKQTHKGTDSVSAFATGLAGASNVFLEDCIPVFDSSVTNNETDKKKIKEIAGVFLTRNTLKPLSSRENTLR
ncbi:hypothetical protein EDC94DRAFT_222963 [Helicostylum pulchrum]|nr:hypothetical protein EDC94DRAFT_222963 [Helicostylum pulchrum]